MLGKSRGLPVKLVAAGATYQRQAPTAALVSAPGKRFARARDLVGKAHRRRPDRLDRARRPPEVAEAGRRPRGRVELSYYAFPDMIGLLTRGKIDAAILPEPYLTQAKQRGSKLVAPVFQSVCTTDCLLTGWVARKDVDRTLAARFRNAIQEAAVWANKQGERRGKRRDPRSVHEARPDGDPEDDALDVRDPSSPEAGSAVDRRLQGVRADPGDVHRARPRRVTGRAREAAILCPSRSRAIVRARVLREHGLAETGERRRLALRFWRSSYSPRRRFSCSISPTASRRRRRRPAHSSTGVSDGTLSGELVTTLGELRPGARARGRRRRPARDRDRQLADARGRDGGRRRVPETDPRRRAHPPRDLWFGLGTPMLRFLVAYAAVWPILVHTVYGVRGVDRMLHDVAATSGVTGASRIVARLGARRASEHRHGHQGECRDRPGRVRHGRVLRRHRGSRRTTCWITRLRTGSRSCMRQLP